MRAGLQCRAAADMQAFARNVQLQSVESFQGTVTCRHCAMLEHAQIALEHDLLRVVTLMHDKGR